MGIGFNAFSASPFIVIAGSTPVIQTNDEVAGLLDCRVKPGNDDGRRRK
jgi:hypothetical protein